MKLQVSQKPFCKAAASLIEFAGKKIITTVITDLFRQGSSILQQSSSIPNNLSRLFTGTQQQSTYGFVNSISIRLYPKPTHSNYTSQSPTGRFKLINLDI